MATETATRFQREAIELDPMAWMVAPRRVFDGRSAIEACLERDECLRGVLVHGLGLGLDVQRDAVDALLADDDDDEADGDEFMGFLEEGRDGSPSRSSRKTRSRLFTAVIAATHEGVMVQAFHASFARDHREVRARLAKRYSREVAEKAEIRRGFHQASPLVIALVPSAISDLIRQVEHGSATVRGYPRTFAIDVQQSVRA
ncbi:MAG: hypothetical protein EOO76_02870 [Novosphingobium sp.]|nr:MAG: hypothetical protein EOO76_02870 [Novosphingobium sp.]